MTARTVERPGDTLSCPAWCARVHTEAMAAEGDTFHESNPVEWTGCEISRQDQPFHVSVTVPETNQDFGHDACLDFYVSQGNGISFVDGKRAAYAILAQLEAAGYFEPNEMIHELIDGRHRKNSR